MIPKQRSVTDSERQHFKDVCLDPTATASNFEILEVKFYTNWTA